MPLLQKGSPDFALPSHFFHVFHWGIPRDSQASQETYIVSWVCHPHSETCPEHLNREASWRLPNQLPEEFIWLLLRWRNSGLTLSTSWMTELLSGRASLHYLSIHLSPCHSRKSFIFPFTFSSTINHPMANGGRMHLYMIMCHVIIHPFIILSALSSRVAGALEPIPAVFESRCRTQA